MPLSNDHHPMQYKDVDNNMSHEDEEDLAQFSELWEPIFSTYPVIIDKLPIFQLRPDNFIVAPPMDLDEIGIEGDDMSEDDLPINGDSGLPVDGNCPCQSLLNHVHICSRCACRQPSFQPLRYFC
jgi:hypothetical protein